MKATSVYRRLTAWFDVPGSDDATVSRPEPDCRCATRQPGAKVSAQIRNLGNSARSEMIHMPD
jgi:hypothetical protein